MRLYLETGEIKEALAETLAKKLSYSVGEFEPDDCWFEVRANALVGEEGGNCEDIFEVKFGAQVDV